MMSNTLPSLLRQARLNAGLSQAKASEYLGYKNRSYVCQIEAGKVELKAVDLLKLAGLYQISLDELAKNFEKNKRRNENE